MRLLARLQAVVGVVVFLFLVMGVGIVAMRRRIGVGIMAVGHVSRRRCMVRIVVIMGVGLAEALLAMENQEVHADRAPS